MKINQNIIQSSHIFVHQEYYNRRFCMRKNKCIIKLKNNQPDIHKIYINAKDPCKAKYQYLISKPEKVELL